MGSCIVALWWLLFVRVSEEPPVPLAATSPTVDFPSLVHYPEIAVGLRDALAVRDASGVLRGLADTFAATRWTDTAAWERLAYIRIGEPGGFVVNRAGEPSSLGPGRYDLGCSGALLEVLRLLWLPRIELADLAACDPSLGVDCEDRADFGHSMLRHVARELAVSSLAADAAPRRIPLRTQALERSLKQPDRLQLCTVSHRASKMKGRRYFHHMIVLDPARDTRGRVHLFDTTGRRGVAYRPIRTGSLVQYLRNTLARGRRFAYVPASVQLHCLAVPLGASTDGPSVNQQSVKGLQDRGPVRREVGQPRGDTDLARYSGA